MKISYHIILNFNFSNESKIIQLQLWQLFKYELSGLRPCALNSFQPVQKSKSPLSEYLL